MSNKWTPGWFERRQLISLVDDILCGILLFTLFAAPIALLMYFLLHL